MRRGAVEIFWGNVASTNVRFGANFTVVSSTFI